MNENEQARPSKPPVPDWRPEIRQPIDMIAERMAYYSNGKSDFVVFGHGTCVLIQNGLPDDQAKAQAQAALDDLFHDHVHMKPNSMDDGNYAVFYKHSAVNIVLADTVKAHWNEIDANHQRALATAEVLFTPLGRNIFDERGKIALFGRCFFFMDAQDPKPLRIVRAQA